MPEASFSKKKVSVKRSKGVKTESRDNRKAHEDEKLSGKLQLYFKCYTFLKIKITFLKVAIILLSIINFKRKI